LVALARVIVRTVAIAAGLHLLRFFAEEVHAPALLTLLNFVSSGWFLVLALTASCAMEDQRALVLAICFLIPLGAAPFQNLDAFARSIVPIGLGILLGTGLRSAAREWSNRDRPPAQPIHRDE